MQKTYDIVGSSLQMQNLRRTISMLAPSMMNVLIVGETGSGKELVAHALHTESNRIRNPFVAVDCGAVPASLFESEFFGHEKGAYTDAKDRMDRNCYK